MLGQAHVQFIEQTFSEFLGEAHPGDAALALWRNDLIAWIYHRLFEEHASVATVRA